VKRARPAAAEQNAKEAVAVTAAVPAAALPTKIEDHIFVYRLEYGDRIVTLLIPVDLLPADFEDVLLELTAGWTIDGRNKAKGRWMHWETSWRTNARVTTSCGRRGVDLVPPTTRIVRICQLP
jgi:hypothetical protein